MQGARLFEIRSDQFIEGDIARARIVNVGRDRRGLRRRAKRAGDKARRIRRRIFIAGGARDFRRRHVHLVGEIFHVVIGLRDALRAKGVRFNDVRTGGQILLVNFLDHLRLRQHQQLVVALDVVDVCGKTLATIFGFAQLVALDHGTHRTVEYGDATLEQIL